MITNNIVAEFACSIDKETGKFKKYQVVSGSVFNEEYSETLDSATVLLSQVKAKDRLYNIKPYDYVRVYDASGNTNFNKLYLVDNFTEKENNIKEHLFGYTINLMSETKILEKVQCPNLTITHRLVDGSVNKKTIFEYICQYMELFIPKIKYCDDGQNWSYQRIIEIPGIKTSTGYVMKTGYKALYNRFNIPCADLSFNYPNLRQLLTILMQQVGCIPVIKNRKLSYLDFQLDAVSFGGDDNDFYAGNTVNYIGRSLASDSYANTLVNASEQVLDSDNEVICETLGFRDRSNMLLKQTENLCLETKFPIYKVNKFVINVPCQAKQINVGFNNCVILYDDETDFTKFDSSLLHNLPTGTPKKTSFKVDSLKEPNKTFFVFLFESFGTGGKLKPYDITFKIDFGTGVKKFEFSKVVVYALNDERKIIDTVEITDIGKPTYLKTIEVNVNLKQFPEHLYIYIPSLKLYYENKQNKEVYFEYDILIEDEHSSYENNWQHSYDTDENRFILFNKDITPLLLENSVRQYLSADFLEMVTQPIFDPLILSKYIYGTIGYSIGSKQISGFSTIFNVGNKTILGWLTKNYTYIENIVNTYVFNNNNLSLEQMKTLNKKYNFPILESSFNKDRREIEKVSVFTLMKDEEVTAPELSTSSIYIPSGINSFVDLFFDIYYQPLNSFNLSFVKSQEDIQFPIEQYDSNASGVSSFARLSINEQEQVDRIGNEVLSISQRTDDIKKIRTFENGPLYFLDDLNRDGDYDDDLETTKYIIFKRSFTIGDYFFNASYVGSKDAVLKNFFTSIRTKYRGYNYIEYSQSIVRKENDTIFVRIGEDFYDGDDKIWWGPWNGNYNYTKTGSLQLIYNFVDTEPVDKQTLNYMCERGYNENNKIEIVKNDLSIICNDNMMGLIYEQPDNVGNGTYISNENYSNSYEFANGSTYKIGGVPQSWQIWNQDSFGKEHNVFYVYSIDFLETALESVYEETTELDNILQRTALSPIVDESDELSKIIKLNKDSFTEKDINNDDSTLTYSSNYFLKVIKWWSSNATQVSNVKLGGGMLAQHIVVTLDLSDGTYSNATDFVNNSNFEIQILFRTSSSLVDLINVVNGSNMALTVLDNSKNPSENDYSRTFYKDYSERLNHTVQFIYYTTSENILWTKYFISTNPLVAHSDVWANTLYSSTSDSDFKVNKALHSVSDTEQVLELGDKGFLEYIKLDNCIRNNWINIYPSNLYYYNDEQKKIKITSNNSIYNIEFWNTDEYLLTGSYTPSSILSNIELVSASTNNIIATSYLKVSYDATNNKINFSVRFQSSTGQEGKYIDFYVILKCYDSTNTTNDTYFNGSIDISNILSLDEVQIDVDDYKLNDEGEAFDSVEVEINDSNLSISGIYKGSGNFPNLNPVVSVPYTYAESEVVSAPYIQITWPKNTKVLKLCYKNENEQVQDIVAFKKPDENAETTRFYITLNDTKTDYVMSEKNGILYKRYMVSKNTFDRTVTKLYNEEEEE